MFIQENNNMMLEEQQQTHEHKHYFIVIKKGKLKFYLTFNDNIFSTRRRESQVSFDMEATDFKLDFRFGFLEKTYENLQQFYEDFKEIRTDLIPSKDIRNVYQPNYTLKWKLEDDELEEEEKVVAEVKPVNKLQFLTEHTKKIICIDYDRVSRKMATGGLDRMIYVYDIRDAYCIGKLEGHKGGIRCLQLMKNRLISGSWDHTIIIWNLRTMCLVTTLLNHSDTVSSLYFDNEYLISGSYDKTIHVWKFNDEYKECSYKEGPLSFFCVVKHSQKIKHHKEMITSLTYDGIKCIISANSAGSVLLIDINGNFLRELKFAKVPELISKIKLVGALLLATTSKGKVVFWNRKTNEIESIIKCTNNKKPINSIAFYDNKFYTADNEFLVKEWDLTTMTCLRHFESHNGPVLDLIVIENKIISCGADKVIIWNLKDNP